MKADIEKITDEYIEFWGLNQNMLIEVTYGMKQDMKSLLMEYAKKLLLSNVINSSPCDFCKRPNDYLDCLGCKDYSNLDLKSDD